MNRLTCGRSTESTSRNSCVHNQFIAKNLHRKCCCAWDCNLCDLCWPRIEFKSLHSRKYYNFAFVLLYKKYISKIYFNLIIKHLRLLKVEDYSYEFCIKLICSIFKILIKYHLFQNMNVAISLESYCKHVFATTPLY